MAERCQRAVAPHAGSEPAQPAPRDVLQKDALDRLARAELEHLLAGRLGYLHGTSVL